ncbi:MFS transporter [Actinoplanes sp. ATCC 53533]|uniref:MFS transporter n=1 Tax=Actinoplanes sp. ATCC 53533 TaxID=1288362 RepID=UPI000F78D419|nr:MFS transporter [Actinoplanes sp. ATCC 53533]RSM73101.1 MFS transporter [Actinoplanes sp. ATCC 53533]
MSDVLTPARPSVSGWIRRGLRPDDPTLRALTWATMAGALSKGVFFSVSVLFFTRVAGLSPATIGLGLTIAGAVAVGASLGSGYLAGAVGARRVLVAATAGQGLALLAYVVVRTPVAFVAVACAAVGLQAVQRTALSTMIAQSFVGPERVEVRARLRVVTNTFIGVGAGLAAVALAIDTDPAYLVAMVWTAAMLFVSAVPVRRLPVGGTAGGPRVRGPHRSPLRDRTYLTAAALNAVMTMQFSMLTVGVPLWITGWTAAPAVTVAGLLALNTVIVSLLQIRATRGTHELPGAGRAVARSGVLLALACALYATADHGVALIAVMLLTLATVAHSLAEVLAEAGNWTLAFELADPANIAAYQGVSTTGGSIGSMLGPMLVTVTAIEHGWAGWALLGGLFLATGLATLVLARQSA